jgi:predicted permease
MFHLLRHAFRSLFKSPGFTLVSILTMAVAIGACTSLFSVLQAVILRPLPYPNPDTLVSIWAVNPERQINFPALSWAKYEAYRQRTDVFADISMVAGNNYTLTDGTGEPEQVGGQQASANFLPMIGVQPIRGRSFTAEEDRDGGPPVAMISQRLWERRYSGAADIVGRAIQIDGTPYTVVGVFAGTLPVPFNGSDVVLPKPMALSFITPQNRNFVIVHTALARLAPGVTLEQANLRVKEMSAQFQTAHPESADAINRNEVKTLSQQVLGNLGRTFWTLAGAVAAVLLIGCANVANLFLARVSARAKEIAVRMSLGASRASIVRQFLAESVAFTILAGLLGVLLAWWSLHGIQVIAGPQLPRADEITLDGGVLAFSLIAALLAAVLIGLYPALQAARTDVQTVLKDSGRGAGGGAAARAFRQILVIAQVALSLTLLICAGLLVLSFYRLQQVDLGFAVEGRAYGLINLPSAKYKTPQQTRDFFRTLQEHIRQAPELKDGALAGNLPLAGIGIISPYAVQGRPVPPVQERPLAGFITTTPDYFTAMGVRLKEGRFFTADDRFESEKVVILNETLAKKLFPGESALNHFLLSPGPNGDIPIRIVGVIRDMKTNGLSVPPPDEIFYPRDQRGGGFMVIMGHAKPGLASSAVIPVLRRLIMEIDPLVALATPRTFDDLVSQSIGVQRLAMTLLLCFAGIAALLAAVGIYSVMAYTVTQRTAEIGVRLALGATTGDIHRLILRAGAIQVGLGLLLGLAGALVSSRLLQEVLYDVKPFDPGVFIAVGVFFALVAALACLIPSRRATRVDPMVALRTE